MRAILLDLDGTMVDSDPVHAAVFVDLLAGYGREIDADYYYLEIHGRQNAAIFADLLPGEDARALSLRKEAMYRERLDEVAPVAGMAEFVARVRGAGMRLGLVTNAPRANADAVLAALDLADAFDAVVIGEECTRGKPDPLPYATALAMLGADPRASLAFEDSPSGIASARGAGLYTYGVRSSLGHDALIAAGADATVADFNDGALVHVTDRLAGADT